MVSYESIFFGYMALLLVLVFGSKTIKRLTRKKEELLMSEVNAFGGKVTGKHVEKWFESLAQARRPMAWLTTTVICSLIAILFSGSGLLLSYITDSSFFVGGYDIESLVGAIIFVFGSLAMINLFPLLFWYWRSEGD